MLNQIHIRKSIGQSLIPNLRVAFFHAIQRLPHGKFSRRSDFQPIIINGNLNISVIQIAAMHRRIDNQLTDGIRRNFINILAVNSYNRCTQMNVS